MNNAERGAGRGERDREGCPRCDPGLLDELKCKAKGIQEQADYNAAHGQELNDAHTAFMAARAAYNTARRAAEPKVADARRQLEELEDRIRCQLDRDQVECIDTAFGRVVERLNRCGHTRGCCCDEDCDYDDEIRDCDPDDIPGRRAVIEYRTKEASDCFWSLIGEHTVPPPPPATSAAPVAAGAPAAAAAAPVAAGAPAAAAAAPAAAGAAPVTPPATPLAALPARVKALHDEIDAISQAAADGSWEPAKLYAAVLVARRHLKDVWRGFRDVNEYMECLCRALTCMIKGHAAIGELIRQAAVDKCYRESWKAACEHLEQYTVQEVLAEYLRICAEGGEEGKGDRDKDRHGGRGDDQDDDQDGGRRRGRGDDQDDEQDGGRRRGRGDDQDDEQDGGRRRGRGDDQDDEQDGGRRRGRGDDQDDERDDDEGTGQRRRPYRGKDGRFQTL